MPLLYKVPHTADPVPAGLLTAENCRSTSRIRAFLRLLRLSSDDLIRQHLNEVGRAHCDAFWQETILPQWEARARVIDYCLGVAAGLKQQEEPAAAHAAYDLRIDPYAAREAQENTQRLLAPSSYIDRWVANESTVESIVREQTAAVLSEKCAYKDWLAEFRAVNRRA